MLTQERLKEVLHYSKEDGIFRNRFMRKNWNTYTGSAAGSLEKGYVRICIDGKRYFAHRLAFLYVEGYMPEHDVDHINRDKSDNRWVNLRAVTRQCNNRNIGLRNTNKSGVTGVRFREDRGKWISFIPVHGKSKDVYRGDDKTEAVAHRLAHEQCLNWAGCNSSTPAFKYMREHVLQLQKS